MGYRRVELESDCLEAVRVINTKSVMIGGSVLAESIKRLLSKNWRVEVRYISREKNRIVDLLAKRGRNMQLVPLRFVTPPVDLERLVEEEVRDLQQSAASSQLVDIAAPFDPGWIELIVGLSPGQEWLFYNLVGLSLFYFVNCGCCLSIRHSIGTLFPI
ncbi:hypothetical protein GQ457_13G012510 [Hibiscus cannabinus]